MIKIKAARIIVILCVSLQFFGCAQPLKSESNEKTVITLCHSEDMSGIEKFVEDRLVDVDLQCESIKTTYLGSTIKRRLKNGHGPDLVMSTQPADEEIARYVLPLDGYKFSSKYESAMLKNLFVDERLYFLPMPGKYTGYIINKTFFDDAGIAVPKTNKQLIDAMLYLQNEQKCLVDSDYAFAISSIDNAAVGTFVVGSMVPDFLATAEGVRWLDDYENKQATMSGSWDSAFSYVNQLTENALIDTQLYTGQVHRIDAAMYLAQGKRAVIYGSSAHLARCRSYNESFAESEGRAYEFEMLPFLSSGSGSGWALSLPESYIGINAGLAESENGKKLDACLRILDVLSTPDGQRELMGMLSLDNSYLRDFESDAPSAPDGLEDAVSNGYVYYVKFPGQVIDALGGQMIRYIAGRQDSQSCLSNVDGYYLHGEDNSAFDLSVIGSTPVDLLYKEQDMRTKETALGNLVADSVAYASGAPIALVNSGGIRASIYAGDVVSGDLAEVCPYDNQILVVKMPGSTLLETLENGVSAVDGVDAPKGRFLQVSGLKYAYNASLPVGSRISGAALSDGTQIDSDKMYTVAINDYMAGARGYSDGNGDGYTMLNLYDGDEPLAQDIEIVRQNMGTYGQAVRRYFSQGSDTQKTAALEERIVISDLREAI